MNPGIFVACHRRVSRTGRSGRTRARGKGEEGPREERWIRSYKVDFIERTRSSGQIGSLHSSRCGTIERGIPISGDGKSPRDKTRANNEGGRSRLRLLISRRDCGSEHWEKSRHSRQFQRTPGGDGLSVADALVSRTSREEASAI